MFIMVEEFKQQVGVQNGLQVYNQVKRNGGACGVLQVAEPRGYNLKGIITLNTGDRLHAEFLNSLTNIFKSKPPFIALDSDKLPKEVKDFIRNNIIEARGKNKPDPDNRYKFIGWYDENEYIRCFLDVYDGFSVNLKLTREEVNTGNKLRSGESDDEKQLGYFDMILHEDEFIFSKLEYIKNNQRTTVNFDYDNNYQIRSIFEIWNWVGDDKPLGYRIQKKIADSIAVASEVWSSDNIGGERVKESEFFCFGARRSSKKELINATNLVPSSDEAAEMRDSLNYVYDKYDNEKLLRNLKVSKRKY